MYNQILVAIDGSMPSRYAGKAAIEIARVTGSCLVACHVYGADIHRIRFTDMEPGLPHKYQEKDNLAELRTTHARLMDEGFKALSAGYLEDFADLCRQSNIKVESVTIEGRSYAGILSIAKKYNCDLIAIGADGLGAIGNGILGGTTTRILQSAPCDVLVARCPMGDNPILTGVDGSEQCLIAVDKAVHLAHAMKKNVHLVAAYDPDFHTNVFNAIAENLSSENQEKVGLKGQKKLHDEIINKGLGKLYENFLDEAKKRFISNGTVIKTFLVAGKAYHALDTQARDCCAGLIVIGRHGHHHQLPSQLGSNAEALLRTSSANVLLVGGIEDKGHDCKFAQAASENITSQTPLSWDSDAQKRLQRVPAFVRKIAKRAVESAVAQSGKNHVTSEDFDNIAARFGMAIRKDNP
jgi:nucleotide-binding universal stress UspA family protein